MDAVYFLRQRTNFIRFFYNEAVKPFIDVKEKIENREPPYYTTSFGGYNDEPPYYDQWMDADVALGLVGLSCISLLSDSLKLYFQTLKKRVIGFSFQDEDRKHLFRDGYLDAYKAALSHILQTDWKDCPVDFAIIEQVVLARNRGQHGSEFRSLDIFHDSKTLTKHPRPFFASADEWAEWSANGGDPKSFFRPTLQISRESLFSSIKEVEALAEWIDERMDKAWVWRSGRRAFESG